MKQVSVFVENRPGSLRQVTLALHEYKMKIYAFSSIDTPEFGILRMVVDKPEEAKQAAYGFIDRSGLCYDVVFIDLPGTVNATGVFSSIVNMDRLIVPVTQNRMVMQSSMSFVLAVRELLGRNPEFPLRDVRLLWNCMDRRASKELYNAYSEILGHLKIPVFKTVLPKAERFNKGICRDGRVFRSTLFAPSPSLLKDSNIDLLADEILGMLNLENQ